MPFGEILSGLAASAIPGIGAQASAQMQRRWALEDLNRQNAYNSPTAQLQRLRDAGLPAAAFFSGGVSSQSDQPRSVNVDPTLGTAEGVQNYFKNRITTMQSKIMEQELRSLTAKADVDVITANYMKGHADGFFKSSGLPPGSQLDTLSGGIPMTREEVRLATSQDSASYDARNKAISANLQQTVYNLQQEFGRDLQSEQLSKLINENAALRQLNLDRQEMLNFQREFIRLYNEGDLAKALGRLIGMYALRSQGR